MKAAVFKAPGKPLSIENVNDPKCGENEMILKVRAMWYLRNRPSCKRWWFYGTRNWNHIWS